ncbi:hypothetical protein HRbin36_02411 [bacterium HR36]|nr:hypothetical protein HRbin36_02411 [bacterium HR36]
MLVEEARWFRQWLEHFEAAELSPMLNVGSQTRRFRQYVQPWIEHYIFGPLARRGVQVLHADIRAGEGVDLVGDLTDPSFLAQLQAHRFRSLFCSNLLEHVLQPRQLAAALVGVLSPGALIFASCPRVFPYHPDPVDTGFRPQVHELAELFPQSELLVGEVVDCGPLGHYLLARLRAWWRERRSSGTALHGQSRAAVATPPSLAWENRPVLAWQQFARIAWWLCRPVAATCVVLRVVRHQNNPPRHGGRSPAGQYCPTEPARVPPCAS